MSYGTLGKNGYSDEQTSLASAHLVCNGTHPHSAIMHGKVGTDHCTNSAELCRLRSSCIDGSTVVWKYHCIIQSTMRTLVASTFQCDSVQRCQADISTKSAFALPLKHTQTP